MSQRPLSTIERVVVIVFALAALVGGVYFAVKSGADPDAYSNDFNVFYHAGREVIAGSDPYQHSIGDWTPYLYPPLLAELIVPLAVLPLPVAAYVWFLISAGSIAATGWMSASLASEKRECVATDQNAPEPILRPEVIAVCAIVLVLRFVLDTFNLGQVNGVVAALAVAHIYFYARDRKTLSSFALVLAASIKLTPALLLVYHIAKLRLKFAAACVTLLLAVTALSFLPFGSRATDAFRTFWNRTVKNEQGYDFAYSGNQSLRGAVARLADRPNNGALTREPDSRKPGDPMTLLISIALLLFSVFAAAGARTELAGVAPFFCCLVLLSPLSWKAHYVILILPIAYLLSVAKTGKRPRPLIAATLGAALLLFNLTSPHAIGLAAAEWADGHSLVVIGALLVFIACSANAWRSGRLKSGT